MTEKNIYIAPDIFRNPLAQKAGAQAFVTLMKKWGIEDQEAMKLAGISDQQTYTSWKKKEISEISDETMLRFSYFLGIHKCLRLLFNNPENVYGWITAKNRAFGGKSAKDMMLGEDFSGIHKVHAHLHNITFI